MKDNLKTYPQDGEWMSAYKWKESFKKELRKKGKTIEQILKEYGIDVKLPPFNDQAIWIDKREILGEKQSET